MQRPPILRSLIGYAKAAAAIAILVVVVPRAITSLHRTELSTSSMSMIVRNSARLLTGAYSIKQAYQNQQGWNGKMPWGGIYPGVEKPWQIAGPGTPIFSFHFHSYCLLPDCIMKQQTTMRLGRRWQTPYLVFLYPPNVAAQALKTDGINYFFFSRELPLTSGLVIAPLFDPSNIAAHLAVRWTDGTSYLLTWPGPNTEPIGDDFLIPYRKAVEAKFGSGPQNAQARADNRKRARRIFEYLKSHANDLEIYPTSLP